MRPDPITNLQPGGGAAPLVSKVESGWPTEDVHFSCLKPGYGSVSWDPVLAPLASMYIFSITSWRHAAPSCLTNKTLKLHVRPSEGSSLALSNKSVSC